MQERIWRRASIKLVPSAALFIISSAIASHYGKLPGHKPGHKLISLIGVALFVIFAITFLHTFTRVIKRLITYRKLGARRAASVQFTLRIAGYLAIFLMALDLLNISVGKLLLGGAVLGIILGVAAQQALGNFFASIVLIISHPFSVGDSITINSGALGGKYDGTIKDIGLTHTKLKERSGKIILLPNATILSGATIIRESKSTNKGQ